MLIYPTKGGGFGMEEINNPVSNSIPRNKIERELML